MSKTPELDKMKEVSEYLRTQEIGEFLVWVKAQGLTLAKWETSKIIVGWYHTETCPEAAGERESVKERRRALRRIDVPSLVDLSSAEDLAPGCCEVTRIEEDGENEILNPIRDSIETLLYRYAGIDPAKIERERRALLYEIRTPKV